MMKPCFLSLIWILWLNNGQGFSFQSHDVVRESGSLAKQAEDFGECGISGDPPWSLFTRNVSYGVTWPWMAALNYGSSKNSVSNFKCTATLISRQWLITPAHCVQGIQDYKHASVLLGAINLDGRVNNFTNPLDASVNKIIVHPEYSTNPVFNDIALIQLNYPIQYTAYIRPACLLSGPDYKIDEYYSRKFPIFVGWGAADGQGSSFIKLQDGHINTVNQSKCKQEYITEKASIINEKVICAGEAGKDYCQKDPEGAIFFPIVAEGRFKLGGIASYGTGRNCNFSPPGVYTRIAQFIDWINQVTGEKF